MSMLLSIVLSCASLIVAENLALIYQWNSIDYNWESPAAKQAAIANGTYNYTEIFTIDVDFIAGKVFVTTPRFFGGVPASLSTVSNKMGDGGPLLNPFPDWSWHTRTDCGGLTSVWRIVEDECHRLWVLDSGNVEDTQVCPAKLLTFDTRTFRLLNTYEIPHDVLYSPRINRTGLLVTPVVETSGHKCQDTTVYIADTDGRGLIVWRNNKIWRLNDQVYSPNPEASTFTIAGESFELADGVLGLAVSPPSWRSGSRNRKLFFRPLASYDQFAVSLDDLHRSHDSGYQVPYQKNRYQLPSQAAAQDFSKDGILFFGLASEIAIACWNPQRPLNAQNLVIVAQNDTTLQFASGVKVKRERYGWHDKEHLWITTNRFQKIMAGSQNWNEPNFRIFRGSVSKLTKGTNCVPY